MLRSPVRRTQPMIRTPPKSNNVLHTIISTSSKNANETVFKHKKENEALCDTIEQQLKLSKNIRKDIKQTIQETSHSIRENMKALYENLLEELKMIYMDNNNTTSRSSIGLLITKLDGKITSDEPMEHTQTYLETTPHYHTNELAQQQSTLVTQISQSQTSTDPSTSTATVSLNDESVSNVNRPPNPNEILPTGRHMIERTSNSNNNGINHPQLHKRTTPPPVTPVDKSIGEPSPIYSQKPTTTRAGYTHEIHEPTRSPTDDNWTTVNNRTANRRVRSILVHSNNSEDQKDQLPTTVTKALASFPNGNYTCRSLKNGGWSLRSSRLATYG